MTTPASSLQSESIIPIQENKIILMLSVTVLLVVMNTTMFNVALPSIMIDFSLNSSTASWLVSGYSIMFAISSLTFSRLSDFIPLSRLFMFGISMLSIASIIGFFSNHFILLLGARIAQAAGGGGIMGLGIIIAGRFPLSRRGRAMALITSTAALAFGLGPLLGGMITQYLGWHYLFMISSISILAVPFFYKLLPKEVLQKGHFDLIGAILTGLSVTSLLLFLTTFSFVILTITIFLFVVWWRYLHQRKEPFIPPILFREKQYIKLLFIVGITFCINFANLFLIPIMLTTLFQKGPIEVGLMIFPGAIIAMIAGQFIGKLIDRVGNMPLIISGQLLLLSATILFASLSAISPYFILLAYIFASVGFTSLATSVSNEVTRILPMKQLGSGIGVAQLVQFFGGGLGVTISGVLLTLQEDVSSELVYRNSYLFFFLVMIIAIFVYGLYYRNAKVTGASV